MFLYVFVWKERENMHCCSITNQNFIEISSYSKLRELLDTLQVSFLFMNWDKNHRRKRYLWNGGFHANTPFESFKKWKGMPK